jgi:hypothetical protein
LTELLAAIALAFTGKPVTIHTIHPWRSSGAAYVTWSQSWRNGDWRVTQQDMFLPRSTARDLAGPRPSRENLDTLTHELVHLRYHSLRHGSWMRRMIRRWMPTVVRLLRERRP